MGSTQDAAIGRARSTGARIVGLLLVGMLTLGACATSSDDSASFESSDTAGEARRGTSAGGDVQGYSVDDGDGEAAPAEQAPADGDPTGAVPVMAIADLGRSIIYTAAIDIVVDDVVDASRRAQEAIAAVGGLVFAQDTTTEPTPRTTLVFKIQPGDFSEAVSRLEGVGRVVSQDISADDVTDRVVDLQSRILTSEVSVARLRGLLDGANTVEAIAALEGQLLDRETNLELLRGQLRTVQGQVSLATITVTIAQEASEPSIEVSPTAYDGDDEGTRCPGERRLDIEEGRTVVLCVTIENTGNIALTGIEVRDLGLDLRREDFTLIDFAEDDRLAPGERVVAWAHFDAEERSRPNPSVTVVPVDEAGDPIRTTTQVSDEALTLTVIPDDSLPGLGDSLAMGVGAVLLVLGVLVIALGVLGPLLILAAPVVAGVVWWRRRGHAPLAPDEPTTATTG